MSKKLEDQMDGLLGDIVGQGWEDPPAAQEPDTGIPTSQEPEYPPVPVREYREPQPHGGSLKRTETVPVPPGGPERNMMDIGLLTDLAAGRTTADQAAAFAGVSVEEVQSSLATALREVPPEEIAKAMGLQAAEQQLKSGAIYGVILADLVGDMAAGKLKPETKIELAKLLARVGRVEPKEDKGVGAGNGFVLNINLGAANEKQIVVDAG